MDQGKEQGYFSWVIREVLSEEMASELRSEWREGLACSWTSGKSRPTSANRQMKDPELEQVGSEEWPEKPCLWVRVSMLEGWERRLEGEEASTGPLKCFFCFSFQIFLLHLLQLRLSLFVDPLLLSVLRYWYSARFCPKPPFLLSGHTVCGQDTEQPLNEG